MRKSIVLIALLALSGSAFAEEENAAMLTGHKLKEAVSGKTIYIMTPLGTEIPIRYSADGTMRGASTASLAALGGESVSPTPAAGGLCASSSASSGRTGLPAARIATSCALPARV